MLHFFPGSFDPVHKGHVQLVKYLLKERLASSIAISATPSPPHKLHKQAPLHHRIHMLRLAFHPELADNSLCITTIERKLKPPHYTWFTLQALQKITDQEISLVVGDDQYKDLYSWYEGRRLSANYRVVVFRRITEDPVQLFEKHHMQVANPVWKVASSDFRKMSIEQNSSTMLPENVFEYILKKKLYQSSDT